LIMGACTEWVIMQQRRQHVTGVARHVPCV